MLIRLQNIYDCFFPLQLQKVEYIVQNKLDVERFETSIFQKVISESYYHDISEQFYCLKDFKQIQPIIVQDMGHVTDIDQSES